MPRKSKTKLPDSWYVGLVMNLGGKDWGDFYNWWLIQDNNMFEHHARYYMTKVYKQKGR